MTSAWLPRRFSLRTVLIIPFILQILITAVVVGWMSFRTGEHAVNDVVAQLRSEITLRIQQHLRTYLETPHLVNQLNANALELKQIALQDFQSLEQHFLKQLQTFTNLSAMYLSTKTGQHIALQRLSNGQLAVTQKNGQVLQHKLLNSQGELINAPLPALADLNLHDFTKIVQKPQWEAIYAHFPTQTLTITAVQPLHDETETSWGTLGSRLILSQLNEFLQTIRISPHGQIFIMECEGALVASSTVEEPIFVDKTQRRRAVDSNVPLIQETARYLNQHFQDLRKINGSWQLDFTLGHQQQFLQVTPLRDDRGMAWLIVVVVPAADFMAPIQTNGHLTLILILIALVIAIFVGVLTSRWITQPILTLNNAAKALAKGTWKHVIPIQRSDELGELAVAFTQMGEQLQQFFETLRYNEARLMQFLEAIPVGVAVFDTTGHAHYFNYKAQQLLGGTVETFSHQNTLANLFYRANTNQLYLKENLPDVCALQGRSVIIDDIEIHRSDKVIPIESTGTPIFDEKEQVIYAVVVIQDVTERRYAETKRTEFAYELFRLLDGYLQDLEQEIAKQTKTLREREQTLRAILRATTDTILLMETDGTILMVINPTNKYKMGMENKVGQCIYDFLPLDGAVKRRANVEKVIAQRQAIIVEEERDGICFEVNFCPVLADDETVSQIAIFSRNITVRKQAEKSLRESESQFKMLFDFAPIGIAWVSIDRLFVKVNQALCEFFGYSEAELVGRSFQSVTHPDDLELSLRKAQSLLEGNTTSCSFEKRYLRKDGSIFHAHLSTSLLRDETGKPLAFITQLQDITAQKQAEQALDESECRFRALIERNADGIILLDVQGTIQFMNPAAQKLLGCQGDELIGTTFGLLPKTSNEPKELEVWSQDKTLRIVNIHQVEIEWQGERAYVASLTDISELKQIERALRKSEARLQAIFNNAAVGIAVLDSEGYYVQVNTRWAEMLGYSVEEFLRLTEIEVTHPDDVEVSYTQFRLIVNGIINFYNIEKRFLCKNGEIFWGDLWVTPIRENGHLHAIVGIIVDLTERKQLEEDLLHSQRFLHSIVEHIPLPLFTKEVANGFRYVLWNKACEETFEAPREKMIGHNVYDLYPPEIATVLHIKDTEAVAAGKLVDIAEEPFNTLTRKTILLRTLKLPLFDNHGNPTHLLCIAENITERKKTEEALRLAQFSLDRSATGIIWLGPAGQHLYVNDAACQIFGYKCEELLLRTLFDISPTITPQLWRSYWQDAKQQGSITFEMTSYRRDGSCFLMEVIANYLEFNGKAYLCTFNRDITERRQAEEVWQLAQFSLDHSADGIQWIKPDGHHLYVNDALCYALGYTREELLMLTVADIDSQLFMENWPTEWLKRKQWGSFTFETRHRRKDGSLFPVEVAANFLEFNGKEYICTIIRDITKRKQVEEALETANRAKNTFLASMSHELRTPLNGILGYAQILQLDSSLSEQQREGIAVIRQSGEHLLTLINDILDLSRIEAGRLELFLTEFHLPTFISSLVDLFRMKTQQKGISFTCEFLPNGQALPTAVKADEKRLRQILLNLLGNAVKFTEHGGVTLLVIYQEDKLVFRIKDTGIGIAEDDLEQIFLPFHQVNQKNHATEGTGLGLPITKRLVEMMGGRLSVSSQVGRGSTFSFELTPQVLVHLSKPVTDNLKIVKGFKYKSADTPIKDKPFTILVVDNKVENRAVLVDFLKPLGFSIKEAENGREALVQALQFQPHVVLMDLVMPVMDGLECTRRLRQEPAFQKTVIIAISANVFKHTQQESLAAGCNVFLPKPVDTSQLLQELAYHCSLEWIYEEPPLKAERKTPVDVGPLISPSREQLETLFEFVKLGDIQEIIEYTEVLARIDIQLQPFAHEVCQLAKGFKIKKLEVFVRKYLGRFS